MSAHWLKPASRGNVRIHALMRSVASMQSAVCKITDQDVHAWRITKEIHMCSASPMNAWGMRTVQTHCLVNRKSAKLHANAQPMQIAVPEDTGSTAHAGLVSLGTPMELHAHQVSNLEGSSLQNQCCKAQLSSRTGHWWGMQIWWRMSQQAGMLQWHLQESLSWNKTLCSQCWVPSPWHSSTENNGLRLWTWLHWQGKCSVQQNQ